MDKQIGEKNAGIMSSESGKERISILEGAVWFEREEANMLTPAEIAKCYRITTRTVLNWIRVNELKAIKVGKQWRINREDWNIFQSKCQEALMSTRKTMGKTR